MKLFLINTKIFIILTISFLLLTCSVPESPDVTQPTCSIDYPANGQAVSGTITIVVGANDNEDINRVVLRIDGEIVATLRSDPYEYEWDTTPIADNRDHRIQARAYDDEGNSQSSGTIEVRVVIGSLPDTLAPVINIIHPVSGSTVEDTVIVLPQISDDSQILKVEYYINGSLTQTVEQSPFTFNWIVSDLLNGSSHSIFARAFDENNNSGYSPAVTVTVNSNVTIDNTPPTIIITNPVTGGTVEDSTTIIAEANDNSGLVTVQFYIDGTLAGVDNNQPYEYRWDVTGLTAGSLHTIYAKASDPSGNESQTALQTVTIGGDLIPPTIFISHPPAGAVLEDSTTIIAVANDNSGSVSVDFYIDGVFAENDSTAPFQFYWDLTGLTPGSVHTLYATATDPSGNESQTASQTITIASGDIEPPTISISHPPAGAVLEDSTTIIAVANDNSGSVAVDFFIDGLFAGSDNSDPFEYFWDLTGLIPGSLHTLHATATDPSGNETQTPLQTVTISMGDITPPTVLILYPPAGIEIIEGTIVNITADVQDNVGVQQVEFYIDGELKSTGFNLPYVYAWDTNGYGNSQEHSIFVKAYDTSGNTGSQLITVIVIP